MVVRVVWQMVLVSGPGRPARRAKKNLLQPSLRSPGAHVKNQHDHDHCYYCYCRDRRRSYCRPPRSNWRVGQDQVELLEDGLNPLSSDQSPQHPEAELWILHLPHVTQDRSPQHPEAELWIPHPSDTKAIWVWTFFE